MELDGRSVDPFLTDAKTGIWGRGTGWELTLFALEAYLRGELPSVAGEEWQNQAPPPEVIALVERSSEAWAALVEAPR